MNYDDIINLPAFKAPDRVPMSAHDRAAQFAPFKAFTGYEDDIAETARLTDKKLELTDIQKNELNERINFLLDNIDNRPKISVEYFIPDEKKSGGMYLIYSGAVRRIDVLTRQMFFTDGFLLSFDDISRIDSNIFE